jgi:hypothetical protein
VTERRGKRRKQLLDDLKEMIGWWKLKEETLYRTLWKTVLEGAMDLSQDRTHDIQTCCIVYQFFVTPIFGKLYFLVFRNCFGP